MTAMSTTRPTAIIALVAALALAGCGSSDSASDDPTGDRALALTAEQVPGLTGQALEDARATLKSSFGVMTDWTWHTDGAVVAADWQAMGEFMFDAGLLTKAPDIDAAIAPEVLAP